MKVAMRKVKEGRYGIEFTRITGNSLQFYWAFEEIK